MSTLKGPVITAAYLKTPPRVDGHDDDWPRVSVVKTDALVAGTTQTTFSTWELGWDDDALYFFVTVTGSSSAPTRPTPNASSRTPGVSFEMGTASPTNGEPVALKPEDLMFIAVPLQGTNQSMTEIRGANAAGSAFDVPRPIIGVTVFGHGHLDRVHARKVASRGPPCPAKRWLQSSRSA